MSKGLWRALSTWYQGREGRTMYLFIRFKPSLNPHIDMEYGAKFSLFEFKKKKNIFKCQL